MTTTRRKMIMKINDLWQRAGKTAVQAFFGVLVPQVTLILTNVLDYDWSQWQMWLLPIVTGALAAGISAGWNAIINANDKAKQEIK